DREVVRAIGQAGRGERHAGRVVSGHLDAVALDAEIAVGRGDVERGGGDVGEVVGVRYAAVAGGLEIRGAGRAGGNSVDRGREGRRRRRDVTGGLGAADGEAVDAVGQGGRGERHAGSVIGADLRAVAFDAQVAVGGGDVERRRRDV